MKKFAVIFAVLFVAFAVNAFADVHGDVTDDATGTFQCNIITPITVVLGEGTFTLGDFVSGATYSTGLTNNVMNFNVTGQGTHHFHYLIDEVEGPATTGDPSLVINWTCADLSTVTVDTEASDNLPADGTLTFTATVASVTAGTNTGSFDFVQTVTVGYNGGF
ncbi:MAG: hypothetical protein HZB41_14440 [Ignavibacteriae bacterium]|nr:hypothetical protein [Ignavibacteriota bacterium]